MGRKDYTTTLTEKQCYADCTKDIDEYKKIKGRKQHIIVDTMGLLPGVTVHASNIHDSKGVDQLQYRFPRLTKIIADGGYRGELIDKVNLHSGKSGSQTIQERLEWFCTAFTMAGKTSTTAFGFNVNLL